jgi:hypothetical protein
MLVVVFLIVEKTGVFKQYIRPFSKAHARVRSTANGLYLKWRSRKLWYETGLPKFGSELQHSA